MQRTKLIVEEILELEPNGSSRKIWLRHSFCTSSLAEKRCRQKQINSDSLNSGLNRGLPSLIWRQDRTMKRSLSHFRFTCSRSMLILWCDSVHECGKLAEKFLRYKLRPDSAAIFHWMSSLKIREKSYHWSVILNIFQSSSFVACWTIGFCLTFHEQPLRLLSSSWDPFQ